MPVCDESPAIEPIPKRRARRRERVPDHLTPAELGRFFGAIDSKRDEAMFRVMYCKGLQKPLSKHA